MADELKVDFGDGVSALDRVDRAIVFMLDGAIGELLRMGYEREFDHITVAIPDDGLPALEMRGRRIYEIRVVADELATILIQGHWVRRPRSRSWLGKWFTRKYDARAA